METVKGFKDYTGIDALKRDIIKGVIAKNFKLYGFELAETPVIEYEEFVKQGNEQDEAISDIFKLQDKGKRNLALRYEFTFQLKRLAQNKKLPYKRYQIGEVFRDETKEMAIRALEILNPENLKYEVLLTKEDEIGFENIKKVEQWIYSGTK